tara:strand:+ start:227 stop:580 length:354 start_codon:yes stop_codon:yes gene_type:complete
MHSPKSGEKILRALIREALTQTDRREVERLAKKQAKKYFDQSIASALETELGKNFLGARGKINKFVDDSITKRFKNSKGDKDFDEAIVRVSRRVLRALYDLHYKRSNLIDNMPIPKT